MSGEQFREKDFKQTVDRNFVPSNPRDNYQTANWQGLIRPSNKILHVSSFSGLLSDLGSAQPSEPKRYVLGSLTHRTRFRPRLGPLGPWLGVWGVWSPV